MRIKPLNLWTFLINSSMKRTFDSIAQFGNNFSNFKQNFSIIWLFLSSQPKLTVRPTILCYWHMFNQQIFCRTPKMSRIFMQIFNIYFQSVLPIWTNFTDSIYYWHLFPLGIWCPNFKNNLKCYLILARLQYLVYCN